MQKFSWVGRKVWHSCHKCFLRVWRNGSRSFQISWADFFLIFGDFCSTRLSKLLFVCPEQQFEGKQLFLKKWYFFANFFGLCAKVLNHFRLNFWAGMSKVHFACPEDFILKICSPKKSQDWLPFSDFKRSLFGFLVDSFQLVFQSCNIRVQRNIFGDFFDRSQNFVINPGL